MRRAALAMVALLVAACGGRVAPAPPDPSEPPPVGEFWCTTAHDRSCPLGYVCEADAGPPLNGCHEPDDVGDVRGCRPVACRAWSDWCTVGDGGAGACSCAAACEAACAGDTRDEQTNLEEAARGGVTCAW